VPAEVRPDPLVLYMLGYTDNAIVEKPFTQEALLSKVRQVLDGAKTPT
jgi:hypothetical protein